MKTIIIKFYKLVTLLCVNLLYILFSKVIGDKKGGETARALMNASKMAILKEINQVVNLPMKFIHVTRNPFDNIATIMLHGVHEREAVREKGGKVR